MSLRESFALKDAIYETSGDLKSEEVGLGQDATPDTFQMKNVSHGHLSDDDYSATPNEEETLVEGNSGEVGTTPRVKASDKRLDFLEDVEFAKTIGGRLEYEEWPWMVSVYRAKDMAFLCAGTLIDDRHILSAAHCYNSFRDEPLVASVGRLLKIGRRKEGIPVDRLYMHEGFIPSCYCNDVAVLRLRTRTDSTPVCLPTFDSAPPVGSNTTLLGWGDRRYVKGPENAGSVRLQRVDGLPIEGMRFCRSTVSRFLHRKLPPEFEDYYLCAGVPDGSKDACLGDSGGPLLQEHDGSWTLVGVVSFGYKCGLPEMPATYTKVSYYLPWILDITDS